MIRIALSAVLAAAALSGGCSDEQQELRSWMEQQASQIPRRAEKISPPRTYEPFRYEAAGEVDPFSPARLAPQSNRPPSSGLRPDTQRARELLEGFPLDTIRMVGHVTNGRAGFALLQVDETVYQARVGNHVGQNYGRITAINEGEIRLKELVQDAAGDWVERETTLQLQESKK